MKGESCPLVVWTEASLTAHFAQFLAGCLWLTLSETYVQLQMHGRALSCVRVQF